MAVGHYFWPDITPIEGITLGSYRAGLKKSGDDVAVIEIAEGAKVSGIFTKNAFCAEPVKICRERLKKDTPRFFLINSGNANACTGDLGRQAALDACQALAKNFSVAPEQVLPFSTGVIGEVLPAEKVIAALPLDASSGSKHGWHAAAQAIMTTDTRAKGVSKNFNAGGNRVNVTGIAKGAGMIKPNMGTMLAYVATDAPVTQKVLDDITLLAANKSFNRITVDGDTSTNDAFMLVATQRANIETVDSLDSDLGQALLSCIVDVCGTLAKEMVRDAEGATKCVEVNVAGGLDAQESLDVAYAICHSPLVKTALYASDPNWGRIIAAIGYAGIDNLNVEKVKVFLDDLPIVDAGGRAAGYTEAAGQQIFDKEEFSINVDLGRGDAKETLWTSDLSHEYVKINAEYRT